MKKNYLLLIAFFFIGLVAINAQHLTYNRYELLKTDNKQASPKSVDNQYDDIKGDAYFSPEWLHAHILSSRGQTYDLAKVKMDLYANKLYADIQDTIFDLSESAAVRCELFPNFPDTVSKVIFQKGFIAPQIKVDQFVQMLADGRLTLLKQQILQIREVHDDGILSTSKKFSGATYYYILKKDSEPIAVRLNKNTLGQQTGDKFKEVSQYIKSKELLASTEEGWAAALAYYNNMP